MILSRASYIQGKDRHIVDVASRTTTVTDAHGKIVVTIEWTGREKRTGGVIRIVDEEPVKFSELFDGCDSVETQTEALMVPTRLGYVWVATRNKLECRSDTDELIAKYHERCVLMGNTIAPSPVPKIGKDYLEFEGKLPDDEKAELLVGYIFMNIMRRTRFNLPRYKFPLIDDSEEARQSIADVISHVKESIARRTANFRRNTL